MTSKDQPEKETSVKLRTASESVGWVNSVGPLSTAPKFPPSEKFSPTDQPFNTPHPGNVVEQALREALEALLSEWNVRKNERVYPYGRRMEVFGNDAYARCIEEVEALLHVEHPYERYK